MQNWAHTRHWKNKVRKHRKGKLRMDNPETLATLGTQDKDKYNVREYRKGNPKWTLQRNWQHRVHKKKTNITLENTERAIKIGHNRETGNIGYTRQRQQNKNNTQNVLDTNIRKQRKQRK